ncbi:FAD binding domain-containing protein [Alkaliphilus serpentinus]|uniref:FAD-binding protein n=1 Tax=Alkaliphilus serpentinus TaxID=1482731 RepID=A0A833HRL9_9FIRM|nr:FAD binding domain-containing protein [Alkaliphilus serpentinus]KAB3533225.1 FAD-binding protein [Alkaliphilus serpentinus]
MISIKEYIAPKSIEEAYNLLVSNKGCTLIGGGAFLRMGAKSISLAIDLSKAGLSYVEEKEETFEIGAMTTFGDIERHKGLNKVFNNLLARSVGDIVGVQLRNLVTVGGTVYSRYGFSDPITALLVLETDVKLYKQGIIPLRDFLIKGSKERDILEAIIIKKTGRIASFQSMRNSKGDYAILNLALSMKDGSYSIAVGARPNRGILATKTMDFLKGKELSKEVLTEATDIIAEEIIFGSNTRGSEAYRRQICKVLLKRALEEVKGYDNKSED